MDQLTYLYKITLANIAWERKIILNISGILKFHITKVIFNIKFLKMYLQSFYIKYLC